MTSDTLLAPLPTEDTDDVLSEPRFFDEVEDEEKLLSLDFDGLKSEAQEREASGDYKGAFNIYEMAKFITNNNEYKKIRDVTYKMADMLHKMADSGTYDQDTSLDYLKQAEKLLDTSDENQAKTYAAEGEYEQAGEITYKLAETLQKRADAGIDELSNTKSPAPKDVKDLHSQLDNAEALLTTVNKYNAKVRSSESKEYDPSPTKKRGFHLGVRAVMHSIKSTMRSALNHRS